MRTLLATVTSSTLVLIAAIPDGDIRWYLALLGCAAVWLLRALGERERKAEHSAFWGDVLSTLRASDEPDQSGPPSSRD